MPITRPVIAGNWKLHKDPADTREFFERFVDLYAARTDRTVIFFPTSLSLAEARDSVRDRRDIALGVQNIFWEASGAYTGEISAPLACAAGATYALVGHSERRHVFGETIQDTERKTSAALLAGLIPVLCVGETLEERRSGRAQQVVVGQLKGALSRLNADTLLTPLIAYEPVWAIGTGETASPDDAAEMHRTIRHDLAERWGADVAAELPILYGGSVNPENVTSLLTADDVDGVLVGGASLDADGFARICNTEY